MKFFHNKKIRQAVFMKPYSFYFLFFLFFYLILNISINKIHITYNVIFLNPVYGIFFVLLTISTTFFVGLNITLIIMRFNELKEISGVGGLTTIGIFLGVLGGACPGCIIGLFPIILGLFGGIGYSLSVLPFNGLELQAISLILLMIGTKLLSKPNVCKIKQKF